MICSMIRSSPIVTMVMREVVGSRVAATERLSMLYPRALNNLFETTRGKLLLLLCQGPRTVNELMEELGVTVFTRIEDAIAWGHNGRRAAGGAGLCRGADRRGCAHQCAGGDRFLVRPRHDHRAGNRAAVHLRALGAFRAADRVRRDRRAGARRARAAAARRHAQPFGAGAGRRISICGRRQRTAGPSRRRAAACAPALARPAHLHMAYDRRDRRPRPCRAARRDRVSDHRPAVGAARRGAAMDRDGADRRRGGDLARAMVADPAAQAQSARAGHLGLGRGGRMSRQRKHE